MLGPTKHTQDCLGLLCAHFQKDWWVDPWIPHCPNSVWKMLLGKVYHLFFKREVSRRRGEERRETKDEGYGEGEGGKGRGRVEGEGEGEGERRGERGRRKKGEGKRGREEEKGVPPAKCNSHHEKQ